MSLVPAEQDGKAAANGGARPHWFRGLYMLLFVVIYNVVEALVLLVAVFQFGHTLITGDTNRHLLDFGRHLSGYVFEIMRYLTYVTDRRPYPFNPWPTPPDETGTAT
ncbi:MAG: DUF4389 domain-containing protein [Gammaproteobacteria bacterium]|nr:DUF4389 domain-containing protein [Gammaproteobacteria bacterium]